MTDRSNAEGPDRDRAAEGHGWMKAGRSGTAGTAVRVRAGRPPVGHAHDKAARLTIGEPGRLMIRWAILGSNQ